MSRTRTVEELAFRSWVEAVLQARDAAYTVVFSHPETARPPFPYAIVQLLSDRTVGQHEIVQTDEVGSIDPAKCIRLTRRSVEMTFSVRVFGDDHLNDANALETARFNVDFLILAAQMCIVVVDTVGPGADTFTNRGTLFESETPVDFRVWSSRTDVQENYAIETVTTAKV